jgi:hypothetical protein
MRPEIVRSANRKFERPTPGRPVLKSQRTRSEDDALQFSITPLPEPAQILRQMPAQAISPALLELLELMSSPIVLIADRPAGELIEMPPARLALKEAA